MEQQLLEKLKNIEAVVFDSDGVFFTGRVYVTPQGEAFKERSHIDGQGISLLRATGMKIAIISGEKTGFLEAIGEKLNSLPSVREGRWKKMGIFTGPQGSKKVDTIDEWLRENKIDWDRCAAMGDDLSDLQLLKKAGFKAAPAQAEDVIKQIADYITPREGGNGAIRDFCNQILKAKGIDPTSLALR